MDIDTQAVEVTKLSLLLKVLEGETQQSLQPVLRLFHERALPDLGDNIKCGNSLIGPDFYQQQQMPLLDDEERYRINVFDWQAEFPQVFRRKAARRTNCARPPPLAAGLHHARRAAAWPLRPHESQNREAPSRQPRRQPEWEGGFDAVIGNPPYVVVGPDLYPRSEADYLRRFQVAQYKLDLFHLFIQRGLELLRPHGFFGYIVPNTWLTLQFTDKLRHYVLRHSSVSELVLFDHQVFQEADVHTALILLEKGAAKSQHCVGIRRVPTASTASDIANCKPAQVRQATWLETDGFTFETRLVGDHGELAAHLMASFPRLDAVARASLGCQAYNSSKHTSEQIANRVFHSQTKVANDYLPELAGKDVSRYHIARTRGEWIKYGPWLHDYRTMDWLTGPRILIREIPGPPPHRILASYVEDTYCHYKTILNVNPSAATKFSMKYLTGILNSRLISFLYPFVSNKMVAQSFPRLSVGDVKKLPVRDIDLSTPSEKKRHDEVVQLAELMLALHQQLAAAKTPQEKTALERQITATDTQLDKLVYDLYGLTQEEINIVEGPIK